MTAQGVPDRKYSESEIEAMKDRELMDFIGQTVATLHRLGDRLEAFAVPASARPAASVRDGQDIRSQRR